MIPDLNSLTVYGVPWMMVGAVIVWYLKKHAATQKDIAHASELLLLFTALWAALGYFLATNLQAIESLWPTMPDILPQLLTIVLIVGSVLGFQPGETANKVVRRLTGGNQYPYRYAHISERERLIMERDKPCCTDDKDAPIHPQPM